MRWDLWWVWEYCSNRFLDRNAVAVEHSLYDHVIYDNSQVERDFALELDKDEQTS